MSNSSNRIEEAFEDGEEALMERWEETKGYLHAIEFPATKDELLEKAQSVEASDTAVGFIKRLAQRTYESFDDMLEAAKKVIGQ
ncbi:MAG: hypothetical protein C0514_08330 [Candidatus Puniceispirillum sp.]|nr:hypothetical protein [Candidatus Puniceispirillum sp.]